MANFSNKQIKRKRPKIRTEKKTYGNRKNLKTVTQNVAEEVVEIIATEEIVEVVALNEEIAVSEETVQDEVQSEEIVEDVEEIEESEIQSEEVDEENEENEEVPLEMSEEEQETVLMEEGSLDGSVEEIEDAIEETETEETVEEVTEDIDEITATEDTVEETVTETEEAIEETVEETTEETVTETTETEEAIEETVEETTEENTEELATTQTAEILEETEDEEVEEESEEESEETEDEEVEEEKVEEKPKKDEFELTAPSNLDDILANICTKRARKLIYRPNEVIFSCTTTVLGTDKVNDEKIKVKTILDAEIKQGVKLGYLDKFDGLKMSELKEEYENDIVYEYADQEFKRTGILLDGDKVKVYVYDWDMKACHHVGYIDDESANLVKPYIIDREKYSFDINGIIVGGKYKKVIKDESTGKITVEKGNDGNLGMEIDINIINRKD